MKAAADETASRSIDSLFMSLLLVSCRSGPIAAAASGIIRRPSPRPAWTVLTGGRWVNAPRGGKRSPAFAISPPVAHRDSDKFLGMWQRQVKAEAEGQKA
jgi:hypothetical protein